MVDEKDQGFTVRDRRIFSSEQQEEKPEPEPTEEKRREQRPPEAGRPGGEAGPSREREIPLPDPSFSTFLTFFFFQQTMMFLGEIPHPETQRTEKNLPMAKYLIDTLALIKEKTRGNLSEEEEGQLDSFLTELRMRYVKQVGV